MSSTGESAANCLSLVERCAARAMCEARVADPYAVKLSPKYRAELEAKGLLTFAPPPVQSVKTSGRKGRRFSEAVVNGTMAKAVDEYLAIKEPKRGQQCRIAAKYKLNRFTFALAVCNARRAQQNATQAAAA